MEIKIFPTVNASLNAIAGICLMMGWIHIRKGNKKIHQKWMQAAFISSTIFLISYLTYHYTSHTLTRYQETGLLRITYFAILISHTLLAIIVPPAAITAIVHAYKGNFDKHTRITKWLTPVWIYVSITGVVVYLMLYIF